ncbi:MAG: hypothetical protein PVH87_21415 [Desulfobacteraceae bacterium]
MAKSSGKVAIREIREGNLLVRLDLSTQMLGLDIKADRGWGEQRGEVEADLYPTLKGIPHAMDFVSASVLAAKAKQFDDGLYAAVELLCQRGTKDFISKREILRRVLETLRDLEGEAGLDVESLTYCRGFIHAAASIGGQRLKETPAVERLSEKIRSDFIRKGELRSKPIGFYTWTEELSQIFQQDRLLQKELTPAEARIMARGFSEGKGTLKPYRAYLSMVEKLTNPFPPEYCHLAESAKIGRAKCQFSFFPPSRAHETELIKRLYGDRPIPRGFSLIDAMIQKVQAGEIDLTPGADSGWYDHQIYALGPFVLPESMPEAKNLRYGQRYKQELVDLFKATLALTRETHIKQLEIPLAGAAAPSPALKIYPELTVEPVATFYLRRARAYRFVRELLKSTFGEDALIEAHRQTASIGAKKPLYQELLDMEALFHGVYLIVAEEIGMEAAPNLWAGGVRGNRADKTLAGKWLGACAHDPDVGTDNRMMVPVFYDVQRKKTKVWVVMGYAVKPLSIWFEQIPEARVTDAQGQPATAELEFEGTEKSLVYPVSAELYVSKLLNRNEFRTLCDRHKTPSAILKAVL